MGPRLLSRGKLPQLLLASLELLASMGPRLLSRGKDANDHQCDRLHYGFNGAAAVEPRKATPTVQMIKYPERLQWGRGC